MSRVRDRCREFGRGLYRGGIGAGVGLVVFFTAYLVLFATRGALTAHIWLCPGFGVAAAIISLVTVTTAGILGRRDVSVWRVVIGSCLGVFLASWGTPLTGIGWQTRKKELLANPLFELEYVWIIFAFNVIAIAVSYASAPSRLECAGMVHEEETLAR